MESIFKIIIGGDFVSSSMGENIFAEIHIETHGISFPDNQWTDFVETILGTWLYNLLDVKNKENIEFTLFFMDGPFWLDVYKDHQMNLSVRCVNNRYDEEVEAVFCCTYVEFLKELHRAFSQFKTYLYKKKKVEVRYESAYKQAILSLHSISDTIKELGAE